MVDQAIINREHNWTQLPPEEQDELEQILKAIHDIQSNQKKIRPEYRRQVFDALVLKIASEMGLDNRGIDG
jgi:predicted nucleic acid-binding protein